MSHLYSLSPDDDLDDVRREVAADRHFRRSLARHPDPRDPDWEGPEWDADDSDSRADDALDPAAINTEWDADAC